MPKGYPQKAQSSELCKKKKKNLGRRKVAPQSKLPIGVGNRDAVKLIGGAYLSVLVALPLPMHAVGRRRPHRPPEVKTGLAVRVGLWPVGTGECGGNVVSKNHFGFDFEEMFDGFSS